MSTYIWLTESTNIHYDVIPHQSMISSFRVIGSFLSRSKIKDEGHRNAQYIFTANRSVVSQFLHKQKHAHGQTLLETKHGLHARNKQQRLNTEQVTLTLERLCSDLVMKCFNAREHHSHWDVDYQNVTTPLQTPYHHTTRNTISSHH